MLDLGLVLMLFVATDSGGGDVRAEAAIPPSPQSITDKEKMVCKRELRTGTLAGYQRTCHTRAEWAKIAQGNQETWQEIQGPHGHTNDRMGADILTPK